MRLVALLALPLLAACTQATASRVDSRTFRIDGPAMGIASDAPDRRLAARLCPNGYRVLDAQTNAGGPDRASYFPGDTSMTTSWTIRCI